MSVCFYNDHGVMAGLDLHTFLMLGPEGIPVPVKSVHLVGMATMGASYDPNKRTYTVLADGAPMIERGFATTAIPHVPLTLLPPHPAELMNLIAIVAVSKSKAVMGIGSVTGEGSPLATCVMGPIGANCNCGPGVGEVLNPSSVVTAPSAADYGMSALAAAVEVVASEIAGELCPDIDNPLVKAMVKKVFSTLLKKAPPMLGGAGGGA